jgi:hypothetical protein
MVKKALRFMQDETAAQSEVEHWGGRVVHKFGENALVAELPDTVDLTDLTASTAEPTQPLDEATQLAVDAWAASIDKQNAGAPTPGEGESWDAPGFEAPLEFDTASANALAIEDEDGTTPAKALAIEDEEVPAPSTGTPTSRFLIGSVSLGLVLVSRDTGEEAMTQAERIRIVQEVQEGLDFLAGVEPRANVSFVYDIRPVTVDSDPGPYPGVGEAYEKFERDWRDAALASMGFPAGRTGYQQYANDLRDRLNTDWAYVAFFTKYPLNHFAYAIFEKVVMHYDNDNWGPENINRVFAHESCHIFGAADEYGTCTCGGSFGHLGAPNDNCVNCFPPGAQVPCLMNKNTQEMCDSSRRQIGWDTDLFPQEAPSAGPLGGVTDAVGGVTDTVGGVTDTVRGATDNLLGGGEKQER